MIHTFVSGALCMGFLIAGIFFLKFWVRSREKLFLFFSAAFWILALERIFLAVQAQVMDEFHDSIYAMRSVAFLLIIVGIIMKNRFKREPRDGR